MKIKVGIIQKARLVSSSDKLVTFKIENTLKGSLDSITSPSPLSLRCEGKTLLEVVNKLLKIKSFLTSPSNVLPYYLK